MFIFCLFLNIIFCKSSSFMEKIPYKIKNKKTTTPKIEVKQTIIPPFKKKNPKKQTNMTTRQTTEHRPQSYN